MHSPRPRRAGRLPVKSARHTRRETRRTALHADAAAPLTKPDGSGPGRVQAGACRNHARLTDSSHNDNYYIYDGDDHDDDDHDDGYHYYDDDTTATVTTTITTAVTTATAITITTKSTTTTSTHATTATTFASATVSWYINVLVGQVLRGQGGHGNA